MVTSISVALWTLLVLVGNRGHRTGISSSTYQKVRSNQSYTFRNSPAMLSTAEARRTTDRLEDGVRAAAEIYAEMILCEMRWVQRDGEAQSKWGPWVDAVKYLR